MHFIQLEYAYRVCNLICLRFHFITLSLYGVPFPGKLLPTLHLNVLSPIYTTSPAGLSPKAQLFPMNACSTHLHCRSNYSTDNCQIVHQLNTAEQVLLGCSSSRVSGLIARSRHSQVLILEEAFYYFS